MRVFITGAGGYIGGTVAARLMAHGHRVTGLARSPERAEQLRNAGIEPVIGSLDDARVLADVARRTDAVINAADSDHRAAAEALIEALAGSGKPLLHTSGISILGDKAGGEPGGRIFTEGTPLDPAPEKLPRVAIDRLVRDAAARNVRSVVLCNPLIYGRGLGLHPDSVQIPALAEQARRSGVASYIGRGLNVWSHAHVEDVADLYLLALERGGGVVLFRRERRGVVPRDGGGAGVCAPPRPAAELDRRRGDWRLGLSARGVLAGIELPGAGRPRAPRAGLATQAFVGRRVDPTGLGGRELTLHPNRPVAANRG